MKTAVLGATGYTGMLLVRLLAAHPRVDRVIPVSSSRAGEPVDSVDPALSGPLGLPVADTYASLTEAENDQFDVVFSALPHGISARRCLSFVDSAVVIDLSADFRFSSPARFEVAYGSPPPAPDAQERAVYGLCEWYRDEIVQSDLIANPGCYPTATLLPLLPLVHGGHIAGTIAIHAMSGISGAGRKKRIDLLYAERTENIAAYNPGTTHRHAHEIGEQLEAAGCDRPALFTPHLVPVKEGMAVTTTVPVDEPARAAEAIVNRYAGEPWVTATLDHCPEARHVRGTNRAIIGIRREEGHLVLMSVIDNLWKGASSQAIQNMNIRFGLDETSGLEYPGEL